MILVTGGAGFIGSHLVDYLISKGHKVRVIDNESATENKKFYWNPEAENHKLDVSDYNATRKLYDNVKVVYHFAAVSRIQPAISSPDRTMDNNILGTLNVLKCSAEAGVTRFVFASSSSVYGNNPVPNVESQNPDCLTVYSSSKVVGENLCLTFNKAYGMQTVSLRFFNVYGDRQPILGKYATVIGLFLKQNDYGQPLTVVGDGQQSRSFTHISDAVDACYLAGTLDVEDKWFGQSYNVGFEKDYKIDDVAKLISKNITYIGERIGEAKNTLASSSKFKEVFGWKPQIALEDWIKDNV